MEKRRPNKNEYGQFYQGYINQVDGNDIFYILKKNKKEVADFFKNIPPEKLEYKYAPDKWTPKDLLLHIIDGERVFAYRALRISRGDITPLPGFDENIFAKYANANSRTVESLISEYETVRESSIYIFENMGEEDANRIGMASGFPASPLAIAYIMAGHELHHVKIIKERYL